MRTTIVLDDKILEKVKILAAKRKVKAFSKIIEAALIEYLKTNKK